MRPIRPIQTLSTMALIAFLTMLMNCKEKHPTPQNTTLTAKSETHVEMKQGMPKDVVGYLDSAWGTSSEQVLKFINAENRGYTSGSDRNSFSFEIILDASIPHEMAEFQFSPDKAHLKMVTISPYRDIDPSLYQEISNTYLMRLQGSYGKPTSTTTHTFFAGRFIIRNWKFSKTRIEFGEFIGDNSLQSRLVIRYLPVNLKGAWDLRDRLFPYSDRITGEPDWKTK